MPRGYPRGRGGPSPKLRYWSPAEKFKTSHVLFMYYRIARRSGLNPVRGILWAVKKAREHGHYIPNGISVPEISWWMRNGTPPNNWDWVPV
jgi:hypothetical protein